MTHQLLSVEDVQAQGPDEAQRVLEWIETYLGREDAEPALGRPYVCPFIPIAVPEGTLWFKVCPDVSEPKKIEALVKETGEQLLQLKPVEGPAARFKSIVLVFPQVSEEKAVVAIDEVQERVKPWLVDNLMMVGELHPRNMTPAKQGHGKPPFDPPIYPNRSPVACLAVRLIVPGDKKFLFDEEAAKDQLRLLKNKIAFTRAQRRWNSPAWISKNSELLDHEEEALAEMIAHLEE